MYDLHDQVFYYHTPGDSAGCSSSATDNSRDQMLISPTPLLRSCLFRMRARGKSEASAFWLRFWQVHSAEHRARTPSSEDPWKAAIRVRLPV